MYLDQLKDWMNLNAPRILQLSYDRKSWKTERRIGPTRLRDLHDDDATS